MCCLCVLLVRVCVFVCNVHCISLLTLSVCVCINSNSIDYQAKLKAEEKERCEQEKGEKLAKIEAKREEKRLAKQVSSLTFTYLIL